jgi:spermidine synthase
VVELSSRHLASIHQGAFRDPRVRLHFTDGRSWLERATERYDLLVLDLTDPIGAARRLCTVEFYRLCRARLSPGGILALHVQSPVTRPRAFARLVQTLRSVFTKVRPYLVFVPTYGTWFGMATASMEVDPLSDTAPGLTRRIQERALTGLRFYNAATHFAAFALPNFVLELLRADVPLLTDDAPALEHDLEFSESDGRAHDLGAPLAPAGLTCAPSQ